MPTPEELARQNIDALLEKCGWKLQTRATINLDAAQGVAIREGLLKGGDEVDYLLFADKKAIGTVEAKPAGFTLTGVQEQSGKYGKGLLDIYPKWREPLPFAYESTGIETQFTNQLDPSPKSRNVFAFHRPETLLGYLEAEHQLNARLTYLLTSDQKVGGSDPSRHAVYYQALTMILATRMKSVFAIGLPLLRRKVPVLCPKKKWPPQKGRPLLCCETFWSC
jgi:type I restriction enzyme R subunit